MTFIESPNYGNIKLMFDSMPYACHLWNTECRMLDCNDASMKMFHVDKKEDFITRFVEFSPEYQPDGSRSSEKAITYLKKAFEEGKCVFEWAHITTEGNPLPCEVTAIRIEGRDESFVVAHVLDQTAHLAMIKEIQYKDHLLYTVNSIAGILLQSPIEDFTENIYGCMGMMTEALDADRAYIWKNYIVNGERSCIPICAWPEKAELLQENAHAVGISCRGNMPEWEQILSSGKCINSVVRNLSPASMAPLSDQGILSVFVAPVFLQDQFWGYIGFDDCHNERIFSDNEELILRSAGLLIANFISKIDMTLQLKEALAEAQVANHAKSNFLSNMSHEIRTPMNAIIGIAELLVREQLSVRQMEYVNDIVVSSKSLLDIINDILDFSKIESGKMELNSVDYDFNVFIDHIESMSVYVAQKKGLEFKLECGKNLPRYLYGDDIRLRQALINICGNAIKFTEKGSVRLKITSSNGSLIFAVKDTGIGIRKEDMAGLFNAFEQVDKAKNLNVVGTGLGLVLSKSFVEMMGGKITVESEYGRGTTFTVVIPVIEGSYENSKKAASKNAAFTLCAPHANILVVDDNEFNLKVASRLLHLMEIHPETADSGYKAIELVKQNDYDIVFMDHMMPEMDGVETVHKIRKLGGKYASLPIIALTANAVGNAREMFLANGFSDFISKPIDINALCEITKRHLPPEKVQTKLQREDQQARLAKEEELLRKATIAFARENQKTFANIAASLNSGDTKTAHRIAHTLKSSAGYLGKKDLQAAAFSLEQSLQGKTAGYTSEQLDILERELGEALHEFEPLLKELGSEKPDAVQVDADKITALLAGLEPLLKKGDFGALSFVEELRAIAGMEELAERIDAYDFEDALHVLHALGKTT